MAKPRVGVVLSGCGVYDGSEIHEAVLTLYHLSRRGAEVVCIAPDIPQMHVINHAQAGAPMEGETRNVLNESARIARGEIRNIAEITSLDLDALILPGGFGAAKNLCDFAKAGAECKVDPEVSRLLLDMHTAKKPIGAMCIAPALIARVFGEKSIPVELTIGDDAATAQVLTGMGARHVDRKVGEIAVDADNRIVTTPAYMLPARIEEIGEGIDALVGEVLSLTA